MGIKFGFSEEKVKTYTTIVLVPCKTYRAIIGHDKSFHRQTLLHYDTALGQSVPCLHDECKRCPAPTRRITYVPAWVFMGPSLQFKERILMVTASWESILAHDLDKWIYTLRRERDASNAPLTWAIESAIGGKSRPLTGFNIEPSLYRMWGIKAPAGEMSSDES